ncbi:MAG: hypothetical protein CMJ29_04600 [Phycisphaerae bacterium]|nr:hypothetical protein [Phycisphaerae bacterium]
MIDVVRTDIEETVDIPVGFSPMVFFTTFDEFALKMEATYWQVTTNYQQIRERPQEFDLSILKRFNQTGLEFAFPTVTIVGEPADDPPPPSATVDSPN